MFIVKSYVVKPEITITDISMVDKNPNDYFLEISQLNNNISKSLNFNQLEGAVVIKYNKESILNFRHWDYIEDFWHSLLNLVESILKNGEGKAPFPDQPTEIILTKLGRNLLRYTLTASKEHTIDLPKYEFLTALIGGAEHFFQSLIKFYPNSKFGLDRVKKLKQELNLNG